MAKKDITPPVDPAENLETAVEQTEFAGNEPLFENSTVPVVKEKETTDEKKPSRKKLYYLIGGGVAGALILLMILVMLPRRQRLIETMTPSPSPSPTVQLNEKQRRVKELVDDLRDADPSKLDLPFPPISTEIGFPEERQ